MQKELQYVYMGIIVPASIIIPITIAILKYKALSAELKIATWYLCLSGIANIITNVLANNHVNNMPAMHIYTPCELIVLILFYKKTLKTTALKKHIDAIAAVFLILCALNALFLQKPQVYNSYTKSIEAIIIIPLAIIYFKETLDDLKISMKHCNPAIYINSGLLLYFSGSFTLFVLSNIITTNTTLSRMVWNTHATLLLALYLSFAAALWKYKS